MRKIIFLTSVLSILAATSLAANPQPAPEYSSTTIYPGMFQADQLYQFDSFRDSWYAHRRLKLWQQLNCNEARDTLQRQGTWTGNLTDRGECAGKAEAPSWANGNYLNYQVQQQDQQTNPNR